MEPNNTDPNSQNQPAASPPEPPAAPPPTSPPVQPQQPVSPNVQQPVPETNPAPTPTQIPGAEQINPPAPTDGAPMTEPEAIVSPPKKSNKKMLIIVVAVVAVLLLVLGGVAAFASFNKKSANNGEDSSNSTQSSQQAAASKEVAADTMSDYSIVCTGGKVTNTNAAATPKHVIFMSKDKTPSGGFTEEFISLTNKEARATTPTDVQLVGCFTATAKTKEAQPCVLTDSDKKEIQVTAYSATYKLEVRDPATGKVLGTETVPGPFTRCPTSLFVSETNPEYVAPPDDGSVNAAIQKYL